MKKHICRILSVILVVCLMVIPVNAASDAETVEAVAVSLPAYTGTLPPVAPMGISKSISCSSKTYSAPLSVDYYVTPGKTKLKIESCTWSPQACDIIIGFYPCDASSGGPYGVRFSGGSISNKTVTTGNVPAGMYWVYVYNAGSRKVTGTINYSVSG